MSRSDEAQATEFPASLRPSSTVHLVSPAMAEAASNRPAVTNHLAVAQSSITPAAAEAPQELEERRGVLHLAQSPSRLAAVLNANLSAAPDIPARDAGLELNPPAEQRSAAVVTAHADQRPALDNEAHGVGALTVEAVLEELYERLRVEFLRTYGTSGE